MQLYDMHTHILPGFDDGSKSVKESLELIDCLKKQGITNICLTPHFYTNEMSVEDYLNKRNEAFERFKPDIPKDINIVLGSEVYVTQYLFSSKDLSGITYGKSRYILTEFAYDTTFSERTMQSVYMLIQNHGLIPVLPHVERYEYLLNNPDVIADLKDTGMLIQTNISNYSEKASFFKKRKLLKYISNGLIDILGSDAHSMTHNTPEVYSQAINAISAKCGTHRLREMMTSAEKIFIEARG